MRWVDLARLCTPVTAAPVQRTRPAPRVETASESGARWGGPSTFPQSRQALTESPALQGVTDVTPSGEPENYMRVIPAQLMLKAERVRVRSETDASRWIEVDRMLRMAFAYTEVPPKASPAGLTPTRTTIVDLTFDLHPPGEGAP